MTAPPRANEILASWSRDWRSTLPVRSPQEESRLLDEARRAVTSLQAAARGAGAPGPALHRKGLLVSRRATLEILPAVPPALQLGPFRAGAAWPAVVRVSSAFPVARPDDVPDQRGLAVRVADGTRRLDLLATTGEAHHARDASAMIASLGAATAAVRGGALGRLGALAHVVRTLGVRDGLRMARTVARAAGTGVSAAALTYFSRAPFQLGPFAVRYRFRPITTDTTPHASGDQGLTLDLRERLRLGPVAWSLELQGYRDPVHTPMADHRVAWDSPWLEVGRLMVRGEEAVDGALTFSVAPAWADTNGPVLEPLGDLNLLRGAAYAASQAGRGAGSR